MRRLKKRKFLWLKKKCSFLFVYFSQAERILGISGDTSQRAELIRYQYIGLGRNFVSKKALRRATLRTIRIDADSRERTQLALPSQFGTVRSDLTPRPSRYRFWVTSSCLALRGIPRSHCAFVRQPVRPGPDRETYIANPPSAATSRRENCAAPTEMTREKKDTTSHHQRPRMMLVTTSPREGTLREHDASGIGWKWRELYVRRLSRRWKRYNNRNWLV